MVTLHQALTYCQLKDDQSELKVVQNITPYNTRGSVEKRLETLAIDSGEQLITNTPDEVLPIGTPRFSSSTSSTSPTDGQIDGLDHG